MNKNTWKVNAATFVFASFVMGGFVLPSVYADASPSPSPNVITNNNNNTNDNINNNNVNVTSPVTTASSVRKVSVGGGQATSSATTTTTTTKGGVEATASMTTKGGLNETPQTGAGTVAIVSLFGAGSLGVYMSRYKKGQLIKETVTENMSQLGSIYVDLRSALKHKA